MTNIKAKSRFKMGDRLKPKLWTVLQEGYSFELFIKDLLAGVIVGIISIPLSIAFAIASGARPEQGLYTAIIAGLAVALFGGSRVQISGPTGAFVLLILSTLQQFGYKGLMTATLIAGLILMVMGFLRFGSLIKFIPYPVTIGFTSGIALIIFTGQVPDLLGLKLQSLPKEFIHKWIVLVKNFTFANPYALSIAALSVAITFLAPRLIKRIPGSLIAITVSTLLVYFLHLPIETVQDRFGTIAASLPSFSLPFLSWNLIVQVIPAAFAIALLGGIESLLSAIVADGMTGRRHRSDMELVAEGFANLSVVFFGGIPATGAIARTATNIKNGGQTPVSAIWHSLTIAVVLLTLGPLVAQIPMAALAGILVVIAYNMSEWRHFSKLFLSPKHDIAVLLTTFFLTVFVDLTTAIAVGIVLAMFLFVNNLVTSSKGAFLKDSLKTEDDKNDPFAIALRTVPAEIEVFEIFGPLFFAAVEQFKTALTRINRKPKVLILRMRSVHSIDATGIRALEDVLLKMRKDKTVLILSGVAESLKKALVRYGFIERLGEEYICPDIDAALALAYKNCRLNIEQPVKINDGV